MRGRLGWLLGVAGLVGLVACASDGSAAPAASSSFDRFLAAVAPGTWRATGDDRIEVWICHVPVDSTADVYGGLPLRLPLTPDGVSAIVRARVTAYFETISHGAYHPRFVAGGEVQMAAAEGPQACVDRAIAATAGDTRAVLAVADAEHAADQPGGLSSGGDPCLTTPPCGVRESRRYAYVGASDFHPDWGDAPPMDLIEHELGHTLGWVHSGYEAENVPHYASALDVMSNSAAPRDSDPNRRDAPDTLAVQRLIAGWLSADDVVTLAASGAATVLPSTGDRGSRVLVLPVDDTSFLAVEVLTAEGFDAHLPAAGVAVHLVTIDGTTVRPLEPLVGAAPFTDLLQPGESLVTHGWRISVSSADHEGWRLTADTDPA